VSANGPQPGTPADRCALSIAADLAWAVTGKYQPKHLATSFVLRNKGGYEAANLLASLGNCAPGRIGAEVSLSVTEWSYSRDDCNVCLSVSVLPSCLCVGNCHRCLQRKCPYSGGH